MRIVLARCTSESRGPSLVGQFSVPVETFKIVGERIDFMGRRDCLDRVSSLPAGCLAFAPRGSLWRQDEEKCREWVWFVRVDHGAGPQIATSKNWLSRLGGDLTLGNLFRPFSSDEGPSWLRSSRCLQMSAPRLVRLVLSDASLSCLERRM